jgi:hypothetical protein
VQWAENEPVLDGGNLPRPFRHLRVTEHRTPDLSSSQVPVHSVLVQKSVTIAPTPQAGFQHWMLGKAAEFRKSRHVKTWQRACKHHDVKDTCSAPSAAFLSILCVTDVLPQTTVHARRCPPSRVPCAAGIHPTKKKSRRSGSSCPRKKTIYPAFTPSCSSSSTLSSAFDKRCARCTIVDAPTWLLRFSK